MLTSPENAALFSQLIARTAQDVDILIDSLPNQEYTPEKQVGLVIVQSWLLLRYLAAELPLSEYHSFRAKNMATCTCNEFFLSPLSPPW